MNVSDGKFVELVAKEVDAARERFPSANLAFVALVEEVGELAQALLKVRAGEWDPSRITEEAVQVATMAQRVATEHDASFQVHYKER